MEISRARSRRTGGLDFSAVAPTQSFDHEQGLGACGNSWVPSGRSVLTPSEAYQLAGAVPSEAKPDFEKHQQTGSSAAVLFS